MKMLAEEDVVRVELPCISCAALREEVERVRGENYSDLLDQMDAAWGNAREIGREEINAFLESRIVHKPTTRLRATLAEKAKLEERIGELEEEVRTLEICIHKKPRPIHFFEDDGTERVLEWEEGDESVGIWSCYRVTDSKYDDLQSRLAASEARVEKVTEWNRNAARLRDEAEAKVEWVCENLPDTMVEYVYTPYTGESPGSGGVSTRAFSGVGFKAELRRRGPPPLQESPRRAKEGTAA